MELTETTCRHFVFHTVLCIKIYSIIILFCLPSGCLHGRLTTLLVKVGNWFDVCVCISVQYFLTKSPLKFIFGVLFQLESFSSCS